MKFNVRYGYIERHWFTIEIEADDHEDVCRRFEALSETPDGLNMNPDDALYSDYLGLDRLLATGPDGVEIDLDTGGR